MPPPEDPNNPPTLDPGPQPITPLGITDYSPGTPEEAASIVQNAPSLRAQVNARLSGQIASLQAQYPDRHYLTGKDAGYYITDQASADSSDGAWSISSPGDTTGQTTKQVKVYDPSLDPFVQDVEAIDPLVKYSQGLFGKGGAFTGPGDTAAAYLQTEGNKSDEIKRQFLDFATRAKDLYDLQDAEQGYSMNADKMNAANAEAAQHGNLAFGMTPFYSNERPGGVNLSEVMRPSLPSYVSPDYRLNSAVGLPGGEGFNNPNYDSSSGLPSYTSGGGGGYDSSGLPWGATPAFAYGSNQSAPSGSGGVDPELAWMIGKPFFKGKLFNYQPGEQMRGFPDKSQQGMAR